MRYFLGFFIVLTVLGALYEEDVSANIKKNETAKTHQLGDSLINPFKDKISSSVSGKEIFNENCASCHGRKGLGNGHAGVNLDPQPDTLTSDEINELSDGALFSGISDGAHGAMIQWKFILSEDQRWHVVDYIRELRKNQNQGKMK